MLKDLFDKGKCALGFHAGDWSYVDATRCLQVRICVRCKVRSEQTIHVWRDWQRLQAGRCEFTRQCARCVTTESKTEHSWGRAAYARDGSCAMVQPCTGCDETKPAGTSHTFDAWGYDAPDACQQTSHCGRCGERGSGKRIEHDWNAWQSSAFYGTRVRVCRRCADMCFELSGAASEVTMQSAARAVNDAVQTTDKTALRAKVEKHRVALLSPVADYYLAYAADQLSTSADEAKTYGDFRKVLSLCREKGIDAVFGPSPEAPRPQASPVSPPRAAGTGTAGNRDARLVGHWRHTEPVSGFTTDTHCVLEANGRLTWWSRSVTPYRVSQSDPEAGTWLIADGRLQLTFDDGTTISASHIVDAQAMVWRDHGRYRFWEKVA